MHHRYLMVPYNETGIREYNAGVDESETITEDKFIKCRDVVVKLKDRVPVFYMAIEIAIEKQTMMALDF